MQAVREALKALDLPEKVNPPRRLLSRISARKNSGRDPGGRRRRFGGRPDPVAGVAERYQRDPARGQRARLRRSPPAHGAMLGGNEQVRERYRRRFQLRARRRVPGHEPHAVRADPAPGRAARQRHRRRRRGPVDLLLARRRHPEHPGLRARLPGRARAAPGGELPLHPGHPRLRLRLVAHNEKRKGKTLRAVKTAGEAVRLHQAGDEYQEAQWVVGRISGLREQGPRGRALPHERPEPLARRGAHAPRPSLHRGGRRRLLRAQGGRRTSSPTCASSAIPPTPSRCGA